MFFVVNFFNFFSANVRKEADRLLHNVEELVPLYVPGIEKPIHYQCLRTMLDGKIKCILSDVSNNGFCNCVICGATPSQMAYPKGERHSFKASPLALSLGPGPLHVRLRTFDYVCKYYFHQDFKLWSCS